MRRRGVGSAKGLRETESRGGAGLYGDPEEYQPASRHAEARGLRAAADPARGRRQAPLETEPEQRRSARQAGGPSAQGRRPARAVRTGKWPHPLPSASTPFENPELNDTPEISGPSGILPLTPTSSLHSGVKCTPVSKCPPHTLAGFVKVSHPVHSLHHPTSSLLLTQEVEVNCF